MKVCRKKPNFKKWTPVVDADGYCKLPPRTARTGRRSFKQGDIVVRVSGFEDKEQGLIMGERYTVDTIHNSLVYLLEIPYVCAAKHFKLLIRGK